MNDYEKSFKLFHKFALLK